MTILGIEISSEFFSAYAIVMRFIILMFSVWQAYKSYVTVTYSDNNDKKQYRRDYLSYIATMIIVFLIIIYIVCEFRFF